MARFSISLTTPPLLRDIGAFFAFLRQYLRLRGYKWFARFEGLKDIFVDLLYKQRGRYTRPFLHFGTIGVAFLVITFGPLVLSQAQAENDPQPDQNILAPSVEGSNSFTTDSAELVKTYRGGQITNHVVKEGETLSSIAQTYGLQVSTIVWENDLNEKTPLKPGQELRILPIDGVRHKVARGETIFSIAKKYGLEDEAEAQPIFDYPFNEFLNDETFELATGQYIVVPGGVKPDPVRPQARVARVLTPDAGSVTATGSFVWPAAGLITQRYSFFHKAVDIANRSLGPILAADAGTVVAAGWDSSGYGNRIMIDHGNGNVTLYAHMSLLQVQTGQRVNRGDVIGQMGSTGRSTGPHLHFEIRQGGVLLNPLNFLR